MSNLFSVSVSAVNAGCIVKLAPFPNGDIELSVQRGPKIIRRVVSKNDEAVVASLLEMMVSSATSE